MTSISGPNSPDALLDGVRAFAEPDGSYSLRKRYGCVNGLPAWFTLATVHVREETEIGYTDGAIHSPEDVVRALGLVVDGQDEADGDHTAEEEPGTPVEERDVRMARQDAIEAMGRLPEDFPNYADWPVTLPAGHWRRLRRMLERPAGRNHRPERKSLSHPTEASNPGLGWQARYEALLAETSRREEKAKAEDAEEARLIFEACLPYVDASAYDGEEEFHPPDMLADAFETLNERIRQLEAKA